MFLLLEDVALLTYCIEIYLYKGHGNCHVLSCSPSLVSNHVSTLYVQYGIAGPLIPCHV